MIGALEVGQGEETTNFDLCFYWLRYFITPYHFKGSAIKAYFGHVKRHNTLEKLCMEGMVEGMRGRGRSKRRWSEDVAEWLKTPATRAGATAQDRRLFRSLVWKATSSPDPP
ncbi:hypothetical protein ElyMa_004531400 [Elysia marginata]|uniref:Uncharacterized protein n=1 Tax=Elysia marginata TaxID=1093978 RepID=A0AAV4HPC7_9GAST|nr:hypothetical protein ElyMa_004531400 [Elysia marginata]